MSRLMPNLGGPCGRVRRLYANVAHSIGLYGAPVWAEAISGNRRALAALRTQRQMAVRVVRAYRTVSHAAATLLAGMPPVDLLAGAYSRSYERIADLKKRGLPVTGRTRRLINSQERETAVKKWRDRLREPDCAGQRTVQAILPHMATWLNRTWARSSYRTTQVLTGHGCFGEYLHRIQREDTKGCHHCQEAVDDAQHTLEFCPAWEGQRQALKDRIGPDLTLGTIVGRITQCEEAWEAFSLFCEKVMREKEESERVRRGETNDPPNTQGGGRANRRRRARGTLAHLRAW
ncbi:PREDICTED: uncharacterized protein LOC105556585 [Vollenhovia emeryi]|uniref:uncharacterized protein LOC105556585 n=1 Tax=Vollenhovia emeryi TaxID=411798 RepID=UPI0005F4F5D4|nr:PREDICTED: uncharacterized protein LOC105556585 [Vollenhovia emeryi]